MGLLALIDGQAHFGASLEAVYRLHPTHQHLAARVGVQVPPLTRVADVPPVPARINHNRLIADCPDCHGAEFVWRDGPHLLLCCNCWNGRVGGAWRPVAVPDNLTAIESALSERIDPQSRNWQPGETVDDLRAENAARGGQ